MLRVICFFYLFLIHTFLFAQSNAVNDIVSSLSLRFNIIKPNTEEFNTAEMRVSYVIKNNTVLLDFIVPNDISRYKTTLSDFVILETLTNSVKLQNLKETVVAEGSIYFNYWYYKNYTFSCALPKENFERLITDGLIKATFYFTPNKDFIIERLAQEKLLNSSFVRFFGDRASKTIKYSASKPDKAHYEELSAWLSKLE